MHTHRRKTWLTRRNFKSTAIKVVISLSLRRVAVNKPFFTTIVKRMITAHHKIFLTETSILDYVTYFSSSTLLLTLKTARPKNNTKRECKRMWTEAWMRSKTLSKIWNPQNESRDIRGKLRLETFHF